MISPKYFIESLSNYGINFYTGVPDSLLKDICAYIADHVDKDHNIITANEGAAVGLAAGHYLATKEVPLVYLQNSGEGNILNPLISLIDKDVYNIPVLFLIGWRGQPGVKDEPQHIKQGKVTLSILEATGTKYGILSKDEKVFSKQLADAISYMKETNEPFAFIVEKDTFESYQMFNTETYPMLTLNREEAIQLVASSLNTNDVVVSTTGMISRELFEYREAKGESHEKDFLTVGSMGHASQIALGIALKHQDRTVFCFDGDGSSIMHMGSMAIVANHAPNNYVHVVFNNGAHDSVGGQPTVAMKIKLHVVAEAVGYKNVFLVKAENQLIQVLNEVKKLEGPTFIEIHVKKGNRKNLGRPTTTPVENKEALMNFLNKLK